MGQTVKPDGFLHTPLCRLKPTPSFLFSGGELERFVHSSAERVYVQIGVEGKVPRWGVRWLNTYICQPPLTHMSVYLHCCWGTGESEEDIISDDYDVFGTLSRAGGIRLRDIADAARPLIQEHRLCPNAARYMHNEDGTVRPYVLFQGFLELQTKDPFVVRRRKLHEFYRARSRSRNRRESDEIARYIQYKLACTSIMFRMCWRDSLC